MSIIICCFFRWDTHLYMSLFLSFCLSVFCIPYFRNHASCDYNFWYRLQNDDISRYLFHFCKLFDFFGMFGVWKGKNGSKGKTKMLSVMCHISGTVLWFLVYWCKMIISQFVFLIFSNHWFSRSLVGYKGKKWSKMTRSSVCCTQYFRNSTWYDCHMWYTSLKWCLQFFFVFHFFKILIFLVVSGVKGQIMVQNYKFCPSHSIFQEQYIIYGAHV